MADDYAQEAAEGEAQAVAPRSAQYWHDRLKEYKTAIEEKWATQRENLDRLYSKDERADTADREYAIFWANLEVLKEAAYARTPVPVVAPRFKGSNKLASAGSDALERCLITTFEQSDLDACMREVRDEFLRYARGTARARLSTLRSGAASVVFDHFTASDFAHDPARSWPEVKWVAFRAWLTKKELETRFAEPLKAFGRSCNEIPLKKRDPNSSAADKTEDKAPVWEIWCKTTGLVHFVSEDFPIELDTVEPWLDLTSFWPCPRPAFGTVVPKKLKPVPDIRQYKDQIEEINEYTARIAALSQALRMKGFYQAGMGEISDAIEAAVKSTDNEALLVPISTNVALGPGGFKEAIQWMPVRDAADLVKALVELRRILIDDVYQITGISDIVRGSSEGPRKTATEQQLKSQWGSLRVRGRQNELSRFARDMARLAGEIIAENFPPEQIAEMAQIEVTPENQAGLMQVYEFLKNDRARGFSIEIETDSTIQPDEDAEKQRRTEFVTAVGSLLSTAFPMVQAAPQTGPFIGEVLKFTAQGFRAGRPLEGAIDQLVQQLGQVAAQPQKPDPKAEAEAAKAEGEKAAAAAKVQGAQATTQATVTKANASIMESRQRMVESAQEHGQNLERMAVEAATPPTQTVN